MNKPELLSELDRYRLDTSDFSQSLDRFIFAAIYNLYIGGAEKIHTADIDNYLKTNAVAAQVLEKENGLQFIQDCEAQSDCSNFSFYYARLKKINLLRDLSKNGYDISEFYCEDHLDSKYYEINERFENLSVNDILNKIKGNVASLEGKYAFNTVVEESSPLDGLEELLEELKEKPDVGVKLQGDIYNTVTRGGRKGTLFLRSAPSGSGKSRKAVGDACYIAYPIRYEPQYGKWVATGQCEKVLYVMTEQDPKEIQTMILAYLTGINEEYFKLGTFKEEHQDRIAKAIQIMKQYKDNLLFARVPEPTPSIVKNLFRRYNLQHGVENFFFDYIFSNEAMLSEYRDLKLPEHVCLRLFTTALKNLALELNAFVSTSTQISEQEFDKKSSWKDYHNIAGARAIVHLVDIGCIMSRPTVEELKMVEGFQKLYNLKPNLVIDMFKNRGGRWTMIRIWCYYDFGTCRTYDLFATTPDLKPIEDFQIIDFIEDIPSDIAKEVARLNEDVTDAPEPIENETIELSDLNLAESIKEAFGDQTEQKKRVKDKDWDDLI